MEPNKNNANDYNRLGCAKFQTSTTKPTKTPNRDSGRCPGSRMRELPGIGADIEAVKSPNCTKKTIKASVEWRCW
jgi:hypothetical protein